MGLIFSTTFCVSCLQEPVAEGHLPCATALCAVCGSVPGGAVYMACCLCGCPLPAACFALPGLRTRWMAARQTWACLDCWRPPLPSTRHFARRLHPPSVLRSRARSALWRAAAGPYLTASTSPAEPLWAIERGGCDVRPPSGGFMLHASCCMPMIASVIIVVCLWPIWPLEQLRWHACMWPGPMLSDARAACCSLSKRPCKGHLTLRQLCGGRQFRPCLWPLVPSKGF